MVLRKQEGKIKVVKYSLVTELFTLKKGYDYKGEGGRGGGVAQSVERSSGDRWVPDK